MMRTVALLCLLAASALAQDLTASSDRNGVKLWRDRGGTSGRDLTIYEATRSGSDFYLLGQRAQPNYDKMQRATHSFKERSNRRTLERPTGFRFIWDDRGSTYWDDASVWRPICRPGYEAVGDFFNRKNRQSSPPSELYDKVRCVARDLVEDCDIGNMIWNNAGTIGKFYVSLWEVREGRNSFESGFFYANDQHNSRPNVRAYCLKRYVVREI